MTSWISEAFIKGGLSWKFAQTLRRSLQMYLEVCPGLRCSSSMSSRWGWFEEEEEKRLVHILLHYPPSNSTSRVSTYLQQLQMYLGVCPCPSQTSSSRMICNNIGNPTLILYSLFSILGTDAPPPPPAQLALIFWGKLFNFYLNRSLFISLIYPTKSKLCWSKIH